MEGDIIYHQGTYVEMVLEESGTTRLIACFDFYATRPQPIEIRLYRIEYQDGDAAKHQVACTSLEAHTLYNVLIEKHSPDVQTRLFCLQLSTRVRNGWCINCGTDKDVDIGLCGECRKLPRFNQQ
jgi:hypothetical protein